MFLITYCLNHTSEPSELTSNFYCWDTIICSVLLFCTPTIRTVPHLLACFLQASNISRFLVFISLSSLLGPLSLSLSPLCPTHGCFRLQSKLIITCLHGCITASMSLKSHVTVATWTDPLTPCSHAGHEASREKKQDVQTTGRPSSGALTRFFSPSAPRCALVSRINRCRREPARTRVLERHFRQAMRSSLNPRELACTRNEISP